MEKNLRISKRNRAKRDGLCTKVSNITGVSYEYVRLVRLGERKNKMIEDMISEYAEGENKLLERLEEIMASYNGISQNSSQFVKRKRVKG